jgi:hypothetical protein
MAGDPAYVSSVGSAFLWFLFAFFSFVALAIFGECGACLNIRELQCCSEVNCRCDASPGPTSRVHETTGSYQHIAAGGFCGRRAPMAHTAGCLGADASSARTTTHVRRRPTTVGPRSDLCPPLTTGAAFSRHPAKRVFHYLAFTVASIAALCYLTMATNLGIVHVSG